MGLWYSKNTKLLLRSQYTSKQGGNTSIHYSLAHNSGFKATDGTTGDYLWITGSTTQSTSGGAQQAARSSALLYYIGVPSVATYMKICLDNGAWDDNRYSFSGEVTTLTKSVASTYPGSTVFTITNSTASAVTFNAIVFVSPSCTLTDTTDFPSSYTNKTLLVSAYIFDNNITLSAGQTLTLSFTT